MGLFEYDGEYEIANLCGVDEAGRGPLAGDVYAAACILPAGCYIDGLNDSKKLSEKKRNELFDIITKAAVSWAVGIATVEEIDELNILQATMLAMQRAVDGLSVAPGIVLVDGNQNPKLTKGGERLHSLCVVKGDSTSACIAAASVIAKVSRDRYMGDLAEQYPQYKLEKHKGYGTALHYEMIMKYGISEIHRKSFLKNLDKHKTSARTSGDKGEEKVCSYLKRHGYKITGRNYSCDFGEIDIIAANKEYILFVEVKSRGANTIDVPRAAVNRAKQQKIIKTAYCYLSENRIELQPRFDVAEVVLNEKGEPKQVNYFENAFCEE